MLHDAPLPFRIAEYRKRPLFGSDGSHLVALSYLKTPGWCSSQDLALWTLRAGTRHLPGHARCFVLVSLAGSSFLLRAGGLSHATTSPAAALSQHCWNFQSGVLIPLLHLSPIDPC